MSGFLDAPQPSDKGNSIRWKEWSSMEPDSQSPSPKRVRIADLMRLPAFAELTDKQAAFVAVYVASGSLGGKYDATAAAQRVYQTKNPASAAALGSELLGQAKIRRVLDAHFGRNALDAILADLQRAVKRSLRRGNKKYAMLTPELARALELFEAYITAKGNIA
jgi:hypothetical protein